MVKLSRMFRENRRRVMRIESADPALVRIGLNIVSLQ